MSMAIAIQEPDKHPDGKVDVEVGEGDKDGDQWVCGSTRLASLDPGLLHSRYHLEGCEVILCGEYKLQSLDRNNFLMQPFCKKEE